MATALSKLDDYQLVDRKQDIRGWQVQDPAGKSLGKVEELMVDTDAERVSSIVLDSGAIYRVEDITLGDHVVRLDYTLASIPDVPSAGAVETAARVRLLVMAERRRGALPSIDPDDALGAPRSVDLIVAQVEEDDDVRDPPRRSVILAELDPEAPSRRP